MATRFRLPLSDRNLLLVEQRFELKLHMTYYYIGQNTRARIIPRIR